MQKPPTAADRWLHIHPRKASQFLRQISTTLTLFNMRSGKNKPLFKALLISCWGKLTIQKATPRFDPVGERLPTKQFANWNSWTCVFFLTKPHGFRAVPTTDPRIQEVPPPPTPKRRVIQLLPWSFVFIALQCQSKESCQLGSASAAMKQCQGSTNISQNCLKSQRNGFLKVQLLCQIPFKKLRLEKVT